jgi:hypothetical protein
MGKKTQILDTADIGAGVLQYYLMKLSVEDL